MRGSGFELKQINLASSARSPGTVSHPTTRDPFYRDFKYSLMRRKQNSHEKGTTPRCTVQRNDALTQLFSIS
jgi:hypothetical protein